MALSFRNSVVVVTGASSGIGRATAHAVARRGAQVVLVARGVQALEEVARECRQQGGSATPLPTDMTDDRQVRLLADRVITLFGRIDGWINDAAVNLFGRFEEVPLDAIRRVIDTNLMGYIHGARAAIPVFREQGGGILVNVASVDGCVGQPYASAYAASKFAIRGLSECLRMELTDVPAIRVCTVLPAAVDTPLFQHGANYSGRTVRPASRPLPAAAVAEAIVDALEYPRREVFVGVNGTLLELAKLTAPNVVESRIARRAEREQLHESSAGPSAGNLHVSQAGAVSGGWRRAGDDLPPRRVPYAGLAVAVTSAAFLGLLAWRQIQARASSS